MQQIIQDYIDQINNHDVSLDSISIDHIDASDDAVEIDADIAALMDALSSNPVIAQKITVIEITCIGITNIILPSTLTALVELDLRFNLITAITIPETLVALHTLELRDNKLTTVLIPDTLTALTCLDISENELTDISFAKTLVSLQTVALDKNKLVEVYFPPTLVAIGCIVLSENNLVSVNIPETFTALQWLRLDSNELLSISVPPTLVQLKELGLADNELISVSIPKTLNQLQHLRLESNPLSTATQIVVSADMARRGTNITIDVLYRPDAMLSAEILHEHFVQVASYVKEQIDASDAMRTMVFRVRNNQIPVCLLRTIFTDFLDPPQDIMQEHFNWFKTMLPEQEYIIKTYEQSAELQNLKQETTAYLHRAYTNSAHEATLTNDMIRAHKLYNKRPTNFSAESDENFKNDAFFKMYESVYTYRKRLKLI